MSNQNAPEEGPIDIEQFSKEGREKPTKATAWKIRIDKTVYTVQKPCMTGRELLQLAAKMPPESFRLIQKLQGGKSEPVALEQSVCFNTPGIERFLTIPLDQTEGQQPCKN